MFTVGGAPAVMTFDEAVVAIVAKTKLSAEDVRDLPDLSPDELRTLITAYQRAGTIATRTDWDVALHVLGTVAAVASVVLPITAAVNAVYGLAKVAS